MTKKISAFVIMACLASSLAFAGDKNKSASSIENSKAEAAQTAVTNNAQRDGNSAVKDKKKDKNKAKPPASDQDREFDRVLQGIYG